MRRDMGILAGVSATAIVLAIVVQTGIRGSEAEAPVAAVAPGPDVAPEAAAEGGPAAVTEAATAPDPQAAALAARETEISRLGALLAEREAAYATVEASLTAKDGEISRLNALVAERDAELATLRATLETLRAQAAFDAELTALKGDPAQVRVEPVRAEIRAVETQPTATAASETDILVLPGDRLTAVHFDKASSRLSPGGQAHAAAAVTLADMKIARVRVIGHTDRVGNPARNRVLAEARARAVADFLIAAGLPAEMIEIDGMGETEAPIATDDGVPEPLNRCAEIRVVPL